MAEAMDPDGHVPPRPGASAPANEMILSGYKADDRTSGVPEERRYALESPADATRSRRMRDREVSDKACVEPTVGPSCNLSPTQGAWARPTHPATAIRIHDPKPHPGGSSFFTDCESNGGSDWKFGFGFGLVRGGLRRPPRSHPVSPTISFGGFGLIGLALAPDWRTGKRCEKKPVRGLGWTGSNPNISMY